MLERLSWRDEVVKNVNTTISSTQFVKCMGVHLNKNLTFEAHVQNVLVEMAKHENNGNAVETFL